MRHKLLDCVVLVKDIPESGLRVGDLGMVVAIYEPDGLEVEFTKASGETQAVLTLTEADVRPTKADDIISVRPLSLRA
ncbi:MAG: DUF4926 domain-containing protein [Chloroflexi bacterium CG23_combo_of_CG06-09_8_20_14_all_45_10]|nr:MAG: DUF4926 domain-containing protein [Chloroflexi bacterium CG23_combo_of_CG06-09_8_20_14_all_45_10]